MKMYRVYNSSSKCYVDAFDTIEGTERSRMDLPSCAFFVSDDGLLFVIDRNGGKYFPNPDIFEIHFEDDEIENLKEANNFLQDNIELQEEKIYYKCRRCGAKKQQEEIKNRSEK